jgi:hypothetical protein
MKREKGRERITTSCEYERESCPKVVKKWMSKYHFSSFYTNKGNVKLNFIGPHRNVSAMPLCNSTCVLLQTKKREKKLYLRGDLKSLLIRVVFY